MRKIRMPLSKIGAIFLTLLHLLIMGGFWFTPTTPKCGSLSFAGEQRGSGGRGSDQSPVCTRNGADERLPRTTNGRTEFVRCRGGWVSDGFLSFPAGPRNGGGEGGGVVSSSHDGLAVRGCPSARPFDGAQGERPCPSGWIPALGGRNDPPKADRLPSRGLGAPDSGGGFEGGPGEPEVVAVDYGGEGLAGQGAVDGAAEDVPRRAGLFVDEGA